MTVSAAFRGVYYGYPYGLRPSESELPIIEMATETFFVLELANRAFLNRRLHIVHKFMIAGGVFASLHVYRYIIPKEHSKKIDGFLAHVPTLIALICTTRIQGVERVAILGMIAAKSIISFASFQPNVERVVKVAHIGLIYIASLWHGNWLERALVIGRFAFVPLAQEHSQKRTLVSGNLPDALRTAKDLVQEWVI